MLKTTSGSPTVREGDFNEHKTRPPSRTVSCCAALLAALTLLIVAPPSHNHAQQGKNPQRTGSATQQDDEVERIDTDLTNILLNVVDRNRRFVTTLAREDIRIYEDGQPQEVFTFQRETELPLSLAILIDTSASQEGVMEDEREAAAAFVNSVLRPDRDAASVVSFTGITRIEQPLTRDRARLTATIEKVKVEHNIYDPECGDDETIPPERKARCLTGVWDSIFLSVREVLAHTPASTRRAIVILTDGDDTSSKKGKEDAIEYAVQHNTAVYAIGIRDEDFVGGGKLQKGDLRRVTDGTGGRAFFPKNRRELDAAFVQINQELRAQYLVAYSPTNKKRDGTLRRVTVEVTNPKLRKEKLRLLYRQGYFAKGDAAKAQASPAAEGGVAPPKN